jgi:Flp pilus assembly protein TadD
LSAEIAARAEALLEVERTDEAIDVLVRGLAADPDDTWLLGVLVRAQLDVDPQAAVQTAERLVALEPWSSLAHRYCSIAYQALGRRDPALHHAREAVAKAPQDPWAHSTLATAIGGSKNKTQLDALQAAGKAIELAPNSTAGYFAAGRVEMDAGHWKNAGKWFERVLEIDPYDEPAQINLALAHEATGHIAPALRGMDGLLRFDPTDAHARTRLDDIVYTALVHFLWIVLFFAYVLGAVRGDAAILVLAFFVGWRIVMAFVAVYRLLRQTDMLRMLPWGYIGRLPKRHFWIAIGSASLAVGAVAFVGAIVLPSPPREHSTTVALIALWFGILSSWVRLLGHAWQGWRS